MYISKNERKKLKEAFGLTEGTWSLPFTVTTANNLKKFMEVPRSKEVAPDMLYFIFGDDILFDNILDAENSDDVRFEVKQRLKELVSQYSDDISDKVKVILDSILNQPLNEAEDNITVEVDGEVIADKESESKEEAKDALDGYGPKLALTDLLLQAVNDENEAIQFYNGLIAACIDENHQEIANVIKHIAEEENIHVGMIQHAMSTISEQAKTIKDGEEEASQILSGEEDLHSKEDESET